MNSYQDSYEIMAGNTLQVNQDNVAITNQLPGFAELQASGQSLFAEIKQTYQIQQTNHKGIRPQRDNLRISAMNKAIDLSKRIVAFAAMNNNIELEQRAKYQKYDLKALSRIQFIGACESIITIATTHISSLSTYGVTSELLTDLTNSIQLFENKIDAPKEGQKESKTATQKLVKLFTALTIIFIKMDKLVELLKNSKPEFYDSYQKARRIAKHHGSLMAKGKVIDSITKEHLKGVRVQF